MYIDYLIVKLDLTQIFAVLTAGCKISWQSKRTLSSDGVVILIDIFVIAVDVMLLKHYFVKKMIPIVHKYNNSSV